MATTRAVFLPNNAEFPSTSLPQLSVVHTTARRPVLWFDAAADEACYWTVIAPQGLSGALSLVVHYLMASATTGSVRLQAQVEAITPGDSTDLDAAESLDTANSAGGTVPGTAGFEQAITITLTNADSVAAGDLVRIRLNRDADGTSGTDDATGDMGVLAVEFREA